MKHSDLKQNRQGEGIILVFVHLSVFKLWFTFYNREVRTETQGNSGTCRHTCLLFHTLSPLTRELTANEEKLWRSAAWWLCGRTVILLRIIPPEKDGTHSCLGPLTSINNQDSFPQTHPQIELDFVVAGMSEVPQHLLREPSAGELLHILRTNLSFPCLNFKFYAQFHAQLKSSLDAKSAPFLGL